MCHALRIKNTSEHWKNWTSSSYTAFYFQSISRIFMELDKTMEIGLSYTFFNNISKIFPYYGRGPRSYEATVKAVAKKAQKENIYTVYTLTENCIHLRAFDATTTETTQSETPLGSARCRISIERTAAIKKRSSPASQICDTRQVRLNK